MEMLYQICLKVTRPLIRISSSKDIALWLTTADEENEVQENVVSLLNRNPKYWLVLFYMDG